MTDVLYRWPDGAKFGRPVPKIKFYEKGVVSSSTKDRFVAEVERITWAYKLAPATINLPGSDSVPEIQVFVLDAKGTDVSEVVTVAIDKAIKQPIIFEIVGALGIRTTATPKQVDGANSKLGAYYSTGWIPTDSTREPLPTAINLAALYGALLAPLTSVAVHPGEEVSDVAARLDTVRRLEREVASLERKLRTEPQLNRKVELRRALKTKQAELSALK
ncbi:DUF4391 domain-containing protein [Nocardioides sp. Arc9.136]|uniref:DUF4391 domain-containing protein n=1 Tax=Nocardioides sp. Arc9.136 TaxID=2996826 RepID=UPI00266677FB|nr:DUF4391 domain-containing protein [Nocardioides sp. Arc9.136]WKN47469.1 DUF4391 domain-containing protein [Nocardioides sp. Arc9.136]